MKKVLWVGDAVCDSGFAKCTHKILDTIRKTNDVAVLGINYRGVPHDYPYRIWPAKLGGDFLGHNAIADVVKEEKPDVIVLQNDSWNIPGYLKALGPDNKIPVVGFMAVDSKNVRPSRFKLNDLAHVIFWTEFAENEAKLAGIKAPTSVIPLGVDLDVYTPGSQKDAREAAGLGALPADAFIVGNVNRNQPRKRLDLTIRYVAEWLKMMPHQNVYLYLHVCPTGDHGIDCNQLANYYGLGTPNDPRLILAEPGVWKGLTEQQVVETYRCFDVQINTALGEGWGLTTMEGMACGVPQIVPDWAALGEWPTGAAAQIPVEEHCFSSPANQIGGVLDRRATINALESIYRYPESRAGMRMAGYELVNDPKYRWENIGAKFATTLETVLG